jgi:hypothetical protein
MLKIIEKAVAFVAAIVDSIDVSLLWFRASGRYPPAAASHDEVPVEPR